MHKFTYSITQNTNFGALINKASQQYIHEYVQGLQKTEVKEVKAV